VACGDAVLTVSSDPVEVEMKMSSARLCCLGTAAGWRLGPMIGLGTRRPPRRVAPTRSGSRATHRHTHPGPVHAEASTAPAHYSTTFPHGGGRHAIDANEQGAHPVKRN
jgi:hypothetical protein